MILGDESMRLIEIDLIKICICVYIYLYYIPNISFDSLDT